MKRDDLTGLGGGGNKVRKLEHLCADALAQGCDTLVTGGGRQSNHVRMTAAAANHLGLACTIVLGSDPPDEATGNVVLDQLLGPEIVWAGPLEYYDLEAAIEVEADRLRAAGRRPYAMPLGGASTIGQLGYVRAALELREQLPDTTLIARPTAPAAPTPAWSPGGATTTRCSASTWAPDPTSTTWCRARPPRPRRWPVGRPRRARAAIDHDRVGDGYGAPTRELPRGARPRARASRGCCSIPCTPARRWPASSPRSASGRVPADGTIVFLATGGLPALLTPRYTDWVTEWP